MKISYKFYLWIAFGLLTFYFITSCVTLRTNAANGQIYVSAFKECWTMLINEEKGKGKKWGVFSVWLEEKMKGNYFKTPHSFNNIKPGTYALYVYDPQSVNYDPNFGGEDEKSDGIVIKDIQVKSNDKLEYNFKKSDFQRWHCMSCPWLYIYNGTKYVKYTEILKDIIGYDNKTTTFHNLPYKFVIDGRIRIRIQEEKEEISYIDKFVLRADNFYYEPNSDKEIQKELSTADEKYLILNKGDFIDLEFIVPDKNNLKDFIIEATGYYEPSEELINSVMKKLNKYVE